VTAFRKSTLLALGAFLILGGGGSEAAIPPAEYIIKKIASRRSTTKWLKLTSQVQVAISEEGEPADSKSGFARFKVLTLVDQASRKIKVRVQDESGTDLLTTERSLTDDSPTLQGQTFGRLLFDSSTQDLLQRFKAFEIPVLSSDELLSQFETEPERRDAEQSTLKRLDGKVVWVLGKSAGPRAWIEKDSYIPMLFEMPVAGGLTRSFRLRNARVLQDHPLPLSWALSIAKSGITDANAEKVLIREDITEALALAEAPASQLAKSLKAGEYTAAGEALPSEVRALIERYLALYR